MTLQLMSNIFGATIDRIVISVYLTLFFLIRPCRKIGLAPKAPKKPDRIRYRSAAVSNLTGFMLPQNMTLLLGPTGVANKNDVFLY